MTCLNERAMTCLNGVMRRGPTLRQFTPNKLALGFYSRVILEQFLRCDFETLPSNA